jgi:hypothetical protein
MNWHEYAREVTIKFDILPGQIALVFLGEFLV